MHRVAVLRAMWYTVTNDIKAKEMIPLLVKADKKRGCREMMASIEEGVTDVGNTLLLINLSPLSLMHTSLFNIHYSVKNLQCAWS